MTKDIYQALNEVMKDVGYVQKVRSQGINYSYAGEAALIAAIRPHCVEHGIIIHPQAVSEIRQDSYLTSREKVMNRTTVVMVYRIAHAPSGTFIDVPVTGEGADIGDKSANKAMTGAYKYALRQSLMIETGDDPDKFPSDGNGNTTEADKQPVEPPKSTTEEMVKNFHRLGNKAYGDAWDDERKRITAFITEKHGHKSTSSNDLTEDEMATLIRGMQNTIDSREKE